MNGHEVEGTVRAVTRLFTKQGRAVVQEGNGPVPRVSLGVDDRKSYLDAQLPERDEVIHPQPGSI